MTRSSLDPNPTIQTRPARRAAPRLGLRVTPQVARLAARTGAMDPALIEGWSELVGRELAGLCRPVRLQRRKNAVTLEVSVRDGAAAMRVQYAQEGLLARVRDHLREPRITRLAIRQSGIAAPQSRWASRKLTQRNLAPEPKGPAPRPARSLDEALEALRVALGAPPR